MISLLNMTAHFLLSEWIWGITWGIYMLPFSITILFILFRWIAKLNAIQSLLFTIGAHFFSVLIFTGFVVGVLIFLMRLEYIPDPHVYHQDTYNALQPTLYLGCIYALLQSLFFFIMRKRYAIRFIQTIVLVWISNSIATFLVYLLLSRI